MSLFLIFYVILFSGCSDKRGLINYMIDRAIKNPRGRLINTYLISRLVQFITSMTTRVLCFFSGSINPTVGAPRRWLKPTLWVVTSVEHGQVPLLFVGIWKLNDFISFSPLFFIISSGKLCFLHSRRILFKRLVPSFCVNSVW